MDIIVNTDREVDGSQEQTDSVSAAIRDSLSRFEKRLTRIEVHLRDESAGTSGPEDIVCTLEARPMGRDPVVVSHPAPDVDLAVAGAVRTMRTVLDRTFGRIDARKGSQSMGGAEVQ